MDVLERHSKRVQQVQSEQCQIQQTLVLKQDELTKTANDNTRLFTELMESRKQIDQLQQQLRQKQQDSRRIGEERVGLEQQLQARQAELNKLKETVSDSKALEQSVRQMKMELEIKDHLLEQFTKYNSNEKGSFENVKSV